MKNRNVAIFAIANSVLLSLLSFSAIADTSTPVTPEEKVKLNVGMQLAAEGYKYAQVVSVAASREDELTARRFEATNAYNKWYGLKSAVVMKRYPSKQDFREVEMAANTYSKANKAFIDLQKSILAKNGLPTNNVATKIIALQ